jgi:C4-dicarboxylate-specific signal transduction histidine kinase
MLETQVGVPGPSEEFPPCPAGRGAINGECLTGHLDVLDLGILLIKPEDRSILWLNQAARDLLGSEAELAVFARSLAEKELLSNKVERSSYSVGAKKFGFSIYPARSLKLILCRDISERERLEKVAESLEATALLGRAFLSFRHEMGNPLNSVKVALTVLRDNWERLPRDLTLDFLRRSIEELGRIESFLSQLGTFVRNESLTLEDVEVNEVLEEVARLVPRVFASIPKLRFEVFRDPKGSHVVADPAALSRCLLALLTNAFEAVGGGDLPKVEVRSHAARGQVQIEIHDNGPGIPPSVQPDLFRPFVTTKSQGLGLGLAVTRRTLSEMGASVDVTSDRDGTTARVVFPEAGNRD